MALRIENLTSIAYDIHTRLRVLSGTEVQALLVSKTEYHGFTKWCFATPFLEEVLGVCGMSSRDVQVEVVRVERDCSHRIHLHRKSNAVVVSLGEAEHFPPPHLAKAFFGDEWFDVIDLLNGIPAGTPHGFSVAEGGTLTFLSVQSPPLVGANGHDDFVEVIA